MTEATQKRSGRAVGSQLWSDAKALDDAAARGFGYSLLRRLFIETATVDMFQTLSQDGLLDSFPFAQANESVASGLSAIAEYVKGADKGDDAFDGDAIADMASDYVGLFDLASGKGNRVPAPPIEAIYRSEKRRLFQKETVEVRRAFEAYGLQAERFRQEPDDHLALELQFLAFLCAEFSKHVRKKEYEAAERVLSHQKEFLDGHPLKWIAPFCDDVRSNAFTPVWPGIVDLLEGFLYQDSAYLDKLQPALATKVQESGGTSAYLAGQQEELEEMATAALGESADQAYERAIDTAGSSASAGESVQED